MNFRFRRFLATTTLAVACAAAGSAWAGARDDLKTFTSGLKGLDGQFSQQVFDSRGKVKESTSGRVALSAPRLFRWEYVRPHEQLIVADGKKVWMYEPDLEQATVREQGKEEQNSPLTALINPALLEQQYDVSEEAAQRDGLQWLSLSPKRETEASFQYAALGFNAGPGQDGNHRCGWPAYRDQLQWLEAQPGLRGRHLQLHPAEGHRRHR